MDILESGSPLLPFIQHYVGKALVSTGLQALLHSDALVTRVGFTNVPTRGVVRKERVIYFKAYLYRRVYVFVTGGGRYALSEIPLLGKQIPIFMGQDR